MVAAMRNANEPVEYVTYGDETIVNGDSKTNSTFTRKRKNFSQHT
jgi:hypothetical protein